MYLNTDDPVPSTSDPIPNAYNYDVTLSEARRDFHPAEGESMHSWPVVYLARTWQTRTMMQKTGNDGSGVAREKVTLNRMERVLAERYAENGLPRGLVEVIP